MGGAAGVVRGGKEEEEGREGTMVTGIVTVTTTETELHTPEETRTNSLITTSPKK